MNAERQDGFWWVISKGAWTIVEIANGELVNPDGLEITHWDRFLGTPSKIKS